MKLNLIGGKSLFFIDLGLLGDKVKTENAFHPLEALVKSCLDEGLSVIPVTGLNRKTEYQNAVLNLLNINKRQVCFRVFLNDLRQSSDINKINTLMEYLRLKPETIDLIVDCQGFCNEEVHYSWICNQIPVLNDYRSFTVISGAFPKDLSELKKNKQHKISRDDWINWNKQTKSDITRHPSYGDYTIQWCHYHETTGRVNFSASIRYTYTNYWVIMRGEGVFNDEGPGFRQWPANAQLLCERSEFCGEDFSYRDNYIYTMGMQNVKTGNAETWLRAGINHHLTFVSRQIHDLI